MSEFSYTYVNLVPTGSTFAVANDINNSGQVLIEGKASLSSIYDIYNLYTGAYEPYNSYNGSITSLGINDLSQIVGWGHGVGPGTNFGLFLSNGSWTIITDPIDPPGFIGTLLTGINDSGQIVGFSDVRGFLYQNGSFTTLADPLANGTTNPNAINDMGDIVGYYKDNSGVAHGFLYSAGNYTTIDNPLATNGTYINDINDAGQMAGYYVDGSGHHGFIYVNGTFTTIDHPLGVGTTELTGINNYGQIVGNYGGGGGGAFLGELIFSAATAGSNVYTEFYGVAPTVTELNILVDFTSPQYAYGEQIRVADPFVYAYQALGQALAGSGTQFPNLWGSTNPAYPNSASGDAHFISDAYVHVFGHAANSEQLQHFSDQLSYFENLYAASGAFGSAENVDLSARGAVYGQMIGIEALLDPFGV